MDSPKRVPALAQTTKVYYARAMDDLETAEILRDDASVSRALRNIGLDLVNPYERCRKVNTSRHIAAEQIEVANTGMLRQSDVLLANLSRPDYTYIGVIFEIVDAVCNDIPVVAYVGDSPLKDRFYFHQYCHFICTSLDEAIAYLRRCHSAEGLGLQIQDVKEYYDRVAGISHYRTPKQRDEERHGKGYDRERQRLEEKLRNYCRHKTVLELGCGTGEWTRHIAEVAKVVGCVESSAQMIRRAEEALTGCVLKPDVIQGDFLDESLSLDRHDVIVCYFLLSILPPPLQKLLLRRIRDWMTTEGIVLCAEAIQVSSTPSIGFGRRRIQRREVEGEAFMMYKEYFTPRQMAELLEGNGFQVVHLPEDSRWFAFCAARGKL